MNALNDHKSPLYQEVRLHAALLFRQGHSPGSVVDYLILQEVDEKIAQAMVDDLSTKQITGEYHVKQEGRSQLMVGIVILLAGLTVAGFFAVTRSLTAGVVIAVISVVIAVTALSRARFLFEAASK